MARTPHDTVVVHADESCLGNRRDVQSPGGAASLIEMQTDRGIVRNDLYLSSPATTNNRMALCGAIATLALLPAEPPMRVLFVSDSQYLVRGISEWVRDWRARGWRRKGGAVENLELWQELDRLTALHVAVWSWVRGHTGHPKNEYVNDLAIRAASEQLNSDGFTRSGFEEWLEHKQSLGQYMDYNADQSVRELEAQLLRES